MEGCSFWQVVCVGGNSEAFGLPVEGAIDIE